MDLTDEQKAMLDFERAWWKFAGAKEAAVRETFGCSSVVYYQRLNAALNQPEAMAYDAMLVRRLRRLREARTAQRSMRARLG